MLFSEKERKHQDIARKLEGFLLLGLVLAVVGCLGWMFHNVLLDYFTKISIDMEAVSNGKNN